MLSRFVRDDVMICRGPEALADLPATKLLRQNTDSHSHLSRTITTGVSAIDIALGGLHTCVLVAGGGVKCWGDNSFGQLGNGNTNQQNVAVDVNLGSGMLNANVKPISL